MLLPVLTILGVITMAFATPAPQASAQPCTAPQNRQFDFWLGDWRVVDPQGKPAGTNLVTAVYGGCALQEHWKGVDGDQGSSFNIFNSPTGKWHQTWVDNSGTLLLLDGGSPSPGVMVLTGTRRTKKGRMVEDRITWTKIDQNRVRQLWDFTADGGKKWAVVFDGTYIRQPASSR
jgi:hypothetical protein